MTALISISILGALGLGLASAFADLKGLKIPNKYCLAIIILFLLAYGIDYFSDADTFFSLKNHLIGAAAVFGLTALLYALKLLGAGDSKLATAFGLWTGVSALPVFLFYMTVAGGILGVVAYILQKTKPFKVKENESWIWHLQNGKNAIPYGIAIAFGALAGFIKAGYLDFLIM